MAAKTAPLVLLFACACAGNNAEVRPAAADADAEPPGPEIDGVEIAGKADVDSGDLAEGLANHPPSGLLFKSRARLDRLALDVDRLRVESYFHSIGYFAAVAGEPEVRPAPEGRVVIRFPIDEGPPAILQSVVFEGLPPLGPGEAALRPLFELQSGDRFDYGAYQQAKLKLQAALYRAGYAVAEVKGVVEVVRKTDQVRVRFQLRPGPKARFGDTFIERTGRIPEESIRARVAWEKGEPFDPAALKLCERRLGELQLLGAVRFDLDTEHGPEVPGVHVVVSDTTPHEVRLGFGAGLSTTQYELHLRAGYVQRDFFDPLLTFRAELRPALGVLRADKTITETLQATAELQRDDLFIPRLRGIAGALLSVDQYEVYATDVSAASLVLDRPLFDDALHASLGGKVEAVKLSADLSEADKLRAGIASPELLFSGEAALTLDLRDDVLSPRHGAYADVRGQLGRLVTAPTASFVKLTSEGRAYVPLGADRFVLAGRVRFGAAFPTDGFLPITQRYFAGGSESQRGFGRRQLSPQIVDLTGTRGPVGGAALFDSSLELRLDLFRLFGSWLGIVAFFDAGDVTPALPDLDLGHLYYSAGPGLRYRTPVGPIRLDVGFRLNRTNAEDLPSDPGFAIQFSLGEAF